MNEQTERSHIQVLEEKCAERVAEHQEPRCQAKPVNRPSGLLSSTMPLGCGVRIAEHLADSTVLISVSTLDLLFKRFDMLQEQLDDLKSLESRHLASGRLSATLSDTNADSGGEVAARISALEKTVANQNVIFTQLNSKCQLLLVVSEKIKQTLDNNNNNNKHNKHNINSSCNNNDADESCAAQLSPTFLALENLCSSIAQTVSSYMSLRSQGCEKRSDKADMIINTHEYICNSNKSATQPHPSSINVCSPDVRSKPISDSDCELVLTNVISDCDFDHKQTALAIIKSIVPSFTVEDIVSCRLAARKDRGHLVNNNTRPPSAFCSIML